MAACGTVAPVSLDYWSDVYADFNDRIARSFARTEARKRLRHYLFDLLDKVERKNGWRISPMVRMARRAFFIGVGGALAGSLALRRELSPGSAPTTLSVAAQTAADATTISVPSPIPGGSSVTTSATTVSSTASPSAMVPIGSTGASIATTDANALRIPPLLSPPLRDGVRAFDLTLQRGQMAFEPGRPVDTLGINAPYLGPTLRATQGDVVAFTIVNQIGEPTTLHWHGMHLPAAMDGGPHQEIVPGATWQPSFTIRQEAATLWFHSHMMGSTRAQVTRGLASMFIVDDDTPAQLALPHTYGDDDIPLIFQEYGGANGRIGPGGGGGGRTLVNGTLAPVLATAQPRLRLRLLNASDQQIYTLGFAGDVPFHQVGSDGGLLPAPVRLTRLQLGPAERAEIVVDLADATGEAPLVLQQFGGGGGGGGRGGNAGIVGPGAALLTINGPGASAARAAGLPPLPAQLNSIARLDPAAAVVTRPMVLNGRTINGQSMTSAAAMDDMTNTLQVRLGDLERWDVINRSRDTHFFHIHDVQFQIVSRNGVAPGSGEQGRKDTVMVRPGETVPLLMRFTDYADPDMPYMFHCHILQHEDQGMMGQFVVVSE